MSKYSYPPLEGTGKRPVRSAADQSLRGLGLVVRYHVRQWEARGESRGKGARRALVRGETEGQATELRMEEEIWRRVEERPLRSRSRCPYELEREGRKLANEGGS